MKSLNKEQKNRIVAIIVEKLPSVEAIYLYGSMAEGRERRDSDVDLAILIKNTIGADCAFELRGVLGALLKRDVDILDCRRTKLEMAYQVIMGAQTLFVSDVPKVAFYENNIMSMYANFAVERRELMDQVARTGTIYGR